MQHDSEEEDDSTSPEEQASILKSMSMCIGIDTAQSQEMYTESLLEKLNVDS